MTSQEKIKSFTDYEKFTRCSNPDCLIYLEIQNRFKCNDCKNVFCGEHRINFNHNCEFINSSNINILVTTKKHSKCCKKNCNNKLTCINQFICKKCDKKYCMSHRHDFTHECIKK